MVQPSREFHCTGGVARLLRTVVPAVSLLAASLASAAEPLPVGYFTKQDDFGLLKISPDGEFLAATAGGSDLSALVFINRADMKIVGGLRARGDDEITGFDWVSDTRVIYSYGKSYFGREFVSETGEIFAVDRDGTRDAQLYGYRAGNQRTGSRLGRRKSTNASGELLSVLEDDDEHILILEWPYQVRNNILRFDADAHPRVALLDVYSGSKKWMGSVPLALADVIVDQNEQVRFAVGYDEHSELAVIWKPEPGAEWTQFELPGFVDESVVPRRFTADGSGVLFTGLQEGESIDALYRLDLETAAVERLYQHNEVDIGSVVTDLQGRSVIGVRVHADRLEYHWLNAEDPAARLYRMLQNAFPGKAVEITSVTRNGRLAVVFLSTPTSIPAITICSISRARMLRTCRPRDPGWIRN